MNPSVFVDTDIILDLIAKRQPFFEAAAELFTRADKQELTLFVSSLSFANLHYILAKQKSKEESRRILSRLKLLVEVLPVDEKVIELALNSDFRDFEDAIQYYCATENGLKTLLTRNLKDFKEAKITVMTAETFVQPLPG